MEAGRTMHLIGSFGDQQNELVHEYVALEKRLGRERKELTKQRADADVQLAQRRPGSWPTSVASRTPVSG